MLFNEVKCKMSKVGDVDETLTFGTFSYFFGLFSIGKIRQKFLLDPDLIVFLELFSVLFLLEFLFILSNQLANNVFWYLWLMKFINFFTFVSFLIFVHLEINVFLADFVKPFFFLDGLSSDRSRWRGNFFKIIVQNLIVTGDKFYLMPVVVQFCVDLICTRFDVFNLSSCPLKI